ncbi:Fic family protein [Prosthecobacter sp.]|uniref:Fic family protein n=1 Tax=Prosthecobacter sp. TaxID=1965333 RepID=UPI003784F8B9
MLERFIPPLQDLDPDLRDALIQKLRVRWTHTSTALEGNTLNEGETLGLLQYGLTIAGKPLAHHNEVLGHSRAIDLLYRLIAQSRPLTEADLHELHAAIQTSVEVDYLKPIGAWKREPNSTLAKQGGKTVINDTYAAPEQVPALMHKWFEGFALRRGDPAVSALDAYVWSHATLVRIHPYADGNGRLARLVANVPVIEKGCLPVLVPAEQRLDYIESLASWQLASGALRKDSDMEGNHDSLARFHSQCAGWMKTSSALIDEVRELQKKRRA